LVGDLEVEDFERAGANMAERCWRLRIEEVGISNPQQIGSLRTSFQRQRLSHDQRQ
jgi:hypothetical protein